MGPARTAQAARRRARAPRAGAGMCSLGLQNAAPTRPAAAAAVAAPEPRLPSLRLGLGVVTPAGIIGLAGLPRDRLAAPPRLRAEHAGQGATVNEGLACKRRVFQSLACVFPCNAILFKWKIADSPMCLLCGGALSSTLHSRMRGYVSHNLATKLWSRLAQAPSRWEIQREVSMASLSFVEATLECRDTRQRTYDELAESDLEGPEDDFDLCSGLLRKRPDAHHALASRWGSKLVMILEFTRGNNWGRSRRPDRHTDTDRYKTEWYIPLRDRLLRCLVSGDRDFHARGENASGSCEEVSCIFPWPSWG